jgi:uncharacterized protein
MQSNNSTISPAKPNLSKTLMLLLLVPLLIGLVIHQSLSLGMDLPVMVNIFTIRFLGIFIEAVPFLLLGSVTSGLIEIFVKTEDILRWLPRNRLGAALGGTFLGILFPVCECGVVPVTRRLFTKGLPTSMGIAFLLAAPFMNPIVFASTYIAFGFGPIFISRFVITAVIATTVAVVFSKFSKPEELLKLHSMYTMDKIQPKMSHVPFRGKFLRALYLAGDEFFEMGRFLIVGCALAAMMQTIIPQESLLALGTGSVSSVIFLQILAFILSVCSTVDSFLALAFVNTFTTGAIVGFLSFGPMVDIKSTLMFAGVFKPKIVFYLILLPFMMSLFAGVVINLLMGY